MLKYIKQQFRFWAFLIRDPNKSAEDRHITLFILVVASIAASFIAAYFLR